MTTEVGDSRLRLSSVASSDFGVWAQQLHASDTRSSVLDGSMGCHRKETRNAATSAPTAGRSAIWRRAGAETASLLTTHRLRDVDHARVEKNPQYTSLLSGLRPSMVPAGRTYGQRLETLSALLGSWLQRVVGKGGSATGRRGYTVDRPDT